MIEAHVIIVAVASEGSLPLVPYVVLLSSLYMGYFAQQSLDVLNSDLTVIEQRR